MKKRITNLLILIVLSITLIGCGKLYDEKITIKDPSIKYNSTYDQKYGTTGPLKGNTIVISIFTDDPTTSWTSKDKKAKKTILEKLSEATLYLKNQAAKYNSTATFIYNWEKYSDLKYEAVFKSNLVTSGGENYKSQKAWIQTYVDEQALRNKYQADNVIYLFFLNTDFNNKVKPWTITHNNCTKCDVEFSNIFYRFESIATPSSTIAHEMLHQFGAPDFYVANDYINQNYVDYLSKNGSKDIMFYINRGKAIDCKFTDLDAYYVGIANRPAEANKWNLGKSEYEKS